MDYSKFIYIEKNDYHTKTFLYDFDIKDFTKKQRNTFPNIWSIIAYLDKNPKKQLYLTQTEVEEYFLDWDKIVLNFDKYMQFCENIWKSDERKMEAFLSRGLRHLTEEEKQDIRRTLTEDDILKNIENLTEEERQKLFISLKQIKWIDFTIFNKWKEEIKNILTKEDFENNIDTIFIELGDIKNKEIIKKQLEKIKDNNFSFLENALFISKINELINIWDKNIDNSSEDFWQKLFEEEKYVWVLQQIFSFPTIFLQWETYVWWKNTKWRNWQGWVATDFSFQNKTSKSFAFVEIKTPKTELMEKSVYRWKKDTDNTNEIYSPKNSLSWAIVQLQNQINIWIEDFTTNLWKDFREYWLNHLDATWILLIWNLNQLNSKQKESFLLFRKSIHNITIITFDELFDKIKSLKNIYEN